MKPFTYALLLLFLVTACGGKDDTPFEEAQPRTQTDEPSEPENPNGQENSENPLLQLSGTQLVDADQNPIYLQGVAFSNFIWDNGPLPPEHHTEEDFKRVADMGMNSIRFYLNYTYFEDDADPYTYRQSGWDWLDQNIAWAKKHGVYLILNMHAPQGGYQSQGEGDALWNDMANQDRLIALWKAIAERYADEVQIAGFGPLNEPVPTRSITQWSVLAQKLVDGIRSVNQHHLLFMEKAIYVKNADPDTNFNFPDISGTNIVYEFHGYEPFFYTHQLMEFSGLGDGGTYPDEEKLEVAYPTWYTTSFDNPQLPANTTPWRYFEGVPFTVTDTNIKMAIPALVAKNVSGRVYFDDLVISEYDADGVFIRNIYETDLSDSDGWSYWSRDQSGTAGISTTEGHNDQKSLYIEGATDDANFSNYSVLFETTQNHSYQISGWMKGNNVAVSAECKIRLDYYTTDGPVYKRNKAYLESVINELDAWAKAKNVPLYMGEFGAGYPCFENNKGGLNYVKDMVSIAKAKNIHFTYHTYHEDNFGLYRGYGIPDATNVNQPLIDLFTEILN